MSTTLEILPSPERLSAIRYEEMCRAIEAAYQVDEVKHIMDKAHAIQVYTHQAQNFEAEHQAAEIRLRAARRLGTLLAEREMATPRGSNQHKDVSRDMTHPQPLSDLGITRNQSSTYQKLAAVPEEVFEEAVKASGPISAGAIIAAAKPAPPKVTPVDDRALWLWGRLRDFTELGVLSARPDELMATMTEPMREAVLRSAPLVAAWLQEIVA